MVQFKYNNAGYQLQKKWCRLLFLLKKIWSPNMIGSCFCILAEKYVSAMLMYCRNIYFAPLREDHKIDFVVTAISKSRTNKAIWFFHGTMKWHGIENCSINVILYTFWRIHCYTFSKRGNVMIHLIVL